MNSATGLSQSIAVADLVESWNLVDRIIGLCFDTCTTNTGRIQGTCTRLEQRFEKNLLYFACRHHIPEIILQSVSIKCLGPTCGPETAVFKAFNTTWKNLDHTKFKPGISDKRILQKLQKEKESIIFLLQKNWM